MFIFWLLFKSRMKTGTNRQKLAQQRNWISSFFEFQMWKKEKVCCVLLIEFHTPRHKTQKKLASVALVNNFINYVCCLNKHLLSSFAVYSKAQKITKKISLQKDFLPTKLSEDIVGKY